MTARGVPSPDFSGVWSKVERAKRHIDDLETRIIAYYALKPYLVAEYDDLNLGHHIYQLAGVDPAMPEDIPLIIGDAVHNLRSALDHLACLMVVKPDGNTAFPVWRGDARVPPSLFPVRNRCGIA